MTQQNLIDFLGEMGVVTSGHFVLRSGQHSGAYVNKTRLWPQFRQAAYLARLLADRFAEDDFQTIIGLQTGGWTLALLMTQLLLGQRGVTPVFADKNAAGEVSLRADFSPYLAHKKVLVVDDVITSGQSTRRVINAVCAAGGAVVGLGVIWHRGTVRAAEMGVPKLSALINRQLESWPERDCPLCRENVPFNLDLGYGRR